MSLQELDVVRLRTRLPDSTLPVGALGTIVMVHDGGRAYEVEFIDDEGRTLAVLAIEHTDLEKVTPA